MSALKCAQCGLVNFANETTCKRCRAPLVASSSPDGIVLADGYVLPPPPMVGFPGSGVWRQDSTLVMSKDAHLPDRCVKCNGPAYGSRLKKRMSWHHPAIYILIFVALLIYLIIALILRKSATVELGLCEEHRAKRRRNIWITWLLALLGLIGVIAGASNDDVYPVLIGLLLWGAAIIYAVVAVKIVSPSKIDDKFVWLKGVNKDYLNALPQFPGV